MSSSDERRFILMLAFTGARKSELWALRWPNVELTEDDGLIRLVERCYEGDVAERTKTSAGSREIPFGATVAAILREQASEGRDSPHGLVFPSPEGSYWLGQNFHKRVWKDARTRAGLPTLTLHDLRRFYTTMMRGQGLPTSVTEQILGHVDERTHRGYTQARPEDARLIREASDRAFRRKAA
jgi:integrase